MLHPAIQPYLPKIVILLKAHHIKSAAVFGSATTEHFNDNSDVDFVVSIQEGLDPVEAGEHLWDLTYELQDLLHRKVDLITERSLKNPYFIREINETKMPISGY